MRNDWICPSIVIADPENADGAQYTLYGSAIGRCSPVSVRCPATSIKRRRIFPEPAVWDDPTRTEPSLHTSTDVREPALNVSTTERDARSMTESPAAVNPTLATTRN